MAAEEFAEFDIEFSEAPTTSSPKGRKKQSSASSLGRSLAGGYLGTPGDLLGLVTQQQQQTPGQQALLQAESQGPNSLLPFLGDDDILPYYSKLPQTEQIEALLGEQGQNPVAQHYGRSIGSSLAGGSAGGLAGLGIGAASGGIGATAGELARLVGLGVPWQIAAEFLAPAAGVGTFTKGIKASKAVKTAKALGMTEEQLAPLTRGKLGRSFLASRASSKGAAAKALKNTEEGFNDAYQGLKTKAKNLGSLSSKTENALMRRLGSFRDDLTNVLTESPDTAQVVKSIDKMMEKLHTGTVTPDMLINSYQEINKGINWNSVKGGKKALAKVKEYFTEALTSSSPELASEFKDVNQLYSKYARLNKRIRPSAADDFIKMGEIGTLGAGLATMNLPLLTSVLGQKGARYLTTKYLASSRGQNLVKKLTEAGAKNNQAAVNRLTKQIKQDVAKKAEPDTEEFDLQFVEE